MKHGTAPGATSAPGDGREEEGGREEKHKKSGRERVERDRALKSQPVFTDLELERGDDPDQGPSKCWGPCCYRCTQVIALSPCNAPKYGRLSQSLGPATQVLLDTFPSQYLLCCLGINRSKYLYSAQYLPGFDIH